MPPNRKQHQHNNGNDAGQYRNNNNQARPMKCCVPTECFQPGKLIYLEDIGTSELEVVKVSCNNDHCDQGQYMHRECFETWEQTVLTYLRSCGRARSWSEKQRLQNLWSKKGYDLAFKACSCKCGKGHLRKDLDWTPPARPVAAAAPAVAAGQDNHHHQAAAVANGGDQFVVAAVAANVGGAVAAAQNPPPGPAVNNGGRGAQANGVVVAAGCGKKKKSKSKEQRPSLAISAPVPHPNNNNNNNNNNQMMMKPAPQHTMVSHSLGSNASDRSLDIGLGTSLGSSSSRPRVNSLSSTGSAASSSGVSGSPPSPGAQFGSPVAIGTNFRFRKNSLGNFDKFLGGDRIRHNSGGLFSRRLDFSSFNALPRHKLNSYHIKMEDDGHGNDETRTFILATLLATKSNRISCVLCHTNLIIFDRYPLIDGTFFITPRQHTKACIETAMPDGRTQYLSAVCMSCLEGWSVNLFCKCCRSKWDGSSLVLGTCYSYDIFAAMPCCRDRLACTNCKSQVIPVDQRPNFFSEYSQSFRCPNPNCGLIDFHLAKPLPTIFDKLSMC